jgi:hypothetical protein
MIANTIEGAIDKTVFPVVTEAGITLYRDKIHKVADKNRQRVSGPAGRKFDINKEVITIRN